jgi:hypothetical protein
LWARTRRSGMRASPTRGRVYRRSMFAKHKPAAGFSAATCLANLHPILFKQANDREKEGASFLSCLKSVSILNSVPCFGFYEVRLFLEAFRRGSSSGKNVPLSLLAN